MEIGPIQAIRQISPIAAPKLHADLNGIFAAEFRNQNGRELEQQHRARRGLEGEEPDESLEGDSGSDDVEERDHSVSLFA